MNILQQCKIALFFFGIILSFSILPAASSSGLGQQDKRCSNVALGVVLQHVPIFIPKMLSDLVSPKDRKELQLEEFDNHQDFTNLFRLSLVFKWQKLVINSSDEAGPLIMQTFRDVVPLWKQILFLLQKNPQLNNPTTRKGIITRISEQFNELENCIRQSPEQLSELVLIAAIDRAFLQLWQNSATVADVESNLSRFSQDVMSGALELNKQISQDVIMFEDLALNKQNLCHLGLSLEQLNNQLPPSPYELQ